MCRFVPVLAVVLLLGGCAGDTTTETGESTTSVPAITTTTASTTTTTPTAPLTGTPMLMDTDMAAEGMMSILYLVGRPDIDVRAITVSGTGLVHCEPGVEQALGLVAMQGQTGIPVACGPEEPLEGRNAFPSSWRIGADEAYGATLTEGGDPSPLSAPELLVATISAMPEPVVVYTDGPLTNLALAIESDPTIVHHITMVYAMGGAIDVPGNTIRNSDAEWNVWVDPAAFRVLLESGAPITLVPLDATNQVPLNMFHLETLEAHQATPAAALTVEMLEGNEQVYSGGLYFWDQLNAAILADETLAAFEVMTLSVVESEDASQAGTLMSDSAGTAVRVATSVDRPAFESEFLSALAGEPVGPVVEDPLIDVSFDGESWSVEGPETIAPGAYVIGLSNTGSSDAVAVVGWLTGDATRDDLDSWASENLAQPPFYEIAGVVFAAPNAPPLYAIADFAVPRTYYLVGLDIGRTEGTTLAEIDVTGP